MTGNEEKKKMEQYDVDKQKATKHQLKIRDQVLLKQWKADKSIHSRT